MRHNTNYVSFMQYDLINRASFQLQNFIFNVLTNIGHVFSLMMNKNISSLSTSTSAQTNQFSPPPL